VIEMILANVKVNPVDLTEYIKQVREMILKGRDMPMGVVIQSDDYDRERLHDEFLDKYKQDRGSEFDKALTEHVHAVGKDQGWWIDWDDLP